MRTGGLAADMDLIAVAAKTRGIVVDPGDRAADLFSHRKQAAADILHPGKIGNDIMRPGAHEHLGRGVVVRRLAASPGAAMNEYKHRRPLARGAEDVEPLNLCGAVRDARRLAEAGAGPRAVAGPALPGLHDVGLIDLLVVGGVELDLVVIEKNARPLLVGRRPAMGLDPRWRQDERPAGIVRAHFSLRRCHRAEQPSAFRHARQPGIPTTMTKGESDLTCCRGPKPTRPAATRRGCVLRRAGRLSRRPQG